MKYNIIFGNNYLIMTESSKEVAIRKLDSILSTITQFSLIEALNSMQLESVNFDGSDYSPKAPWNSKWTIPDYFINLVLAKYNVSIAPNK